MDKQNGVLQAGIPAVVAAVEDDLLAILGVTLPEAKAKREGKPVECGGKPPKAAPTRFTEWSNNTSFTDGGYLARLTQSTCETCGKMVEVFEGVFHVEIHRSGTRRLQALDRRAQWPVGVEHALEVTQAFTQMCGGCVRELGFSKERDAPVRPFSLVLKEG